MVGKYIKKRIQVTAVQWDGRNFDEISKFSNGEVSLLSENSDKLIIPTLEGEMCASKGDYIIKGVLGELYPCKPEAFKETYDKVEE